MEQKVYFKEQKKNIVFFSKKIKMRIALCDKNEKFCDQLKESIYRYANYRHLDLVVDRFEYGEQLLESNKKFVMVFIDYSLLGINGLETAKKLREKNINSSIVFLSSQTHFVFESFKVNPFRFLTKPLNQEILFETLDSFFKNCSENRPLWVKDSDITFCLNTGDIMYLEADNKHCFVHLECEKISCNKTMARVAMALKEPYFYKINRAYIINLRFVAKYTNEMIFLKNGQSLHISRNYISGFKEYYKNFCNPKIP